MRSSSGRRNYKSSNTENSFTVSNYKSHDVQEYKKLQEKNNKSIFSR